MKPISVQLNITSISAKPDGSIRLSAYTPELTPQQKAIFFSLQNLNCKTLIQPEDSNEMPEEIKTDIDVKTPAQRLRSTLFVLWKQTDGKTDFNQFYAARMEKLIDAVKRQLD